MSSVVEGKVRRAQQQLTAAEELEKQGNREAALAKYTQGLAILMGVRKQVPPQTWQHLMPKVNAYMRHAERLKSAIESGSATAADSSANGGKKSGKNSAVDDELRTRVCRDILEKKSKVKFDDVVGLDDVKQLLLEAVVWPSLRPDLFVDLRRPPRGLLLFGPPGNGKTMIAKAVASECDATFFNISAGSLLSRYVGDSERLVRALFAEARARAPSIIFVDEVDSLLASRGGGDSSSSSDTMHRFQNQFISEWNGVSDDGSRVLLIGATNLPEAIDEAARRRFELRVMVPMPTAEVRRAVLNRLILNPPRGTTVKHTLSERQAQQVVQATEGYSCSDLKTLCSQAAMLPLRSVSSNDIRQIRTEDIPAVSLAHFQSAMRAVPPSVSPESLAHYARWNDMYGTRLGGVPSAHQRLDRRQVPAQHTRTPVPLS
ncbi:MAG: hypothetical protein MHM6MM_000518 [Cercozoa sp. M6MM]